MVWESEFNSNVIPGFGGGINRELPPNEIADDEAVDILNFTFDEDSNLVTRCGVVKDNSSPSAFGSRITALFAATFASGVTHLIATSGSEIYYRSSANTYTSIKGAATLPSDVFWSFCMLNNLVIGANSASTGSGQLNPIKWTGSGNIAQLADGAGNAPRLKFVCVWKNRVFGVSADEPNTLHFCKLADPENWTSGGGSIEVGADDGDNITALYAHKGELIIFKRSRVYKLFAFRTDLADTDPTAWKVDEYSKNVGSISHTCPKDALDDLIFPAVGGVTGLEVSERTGGFETSFLSQKIPDLINVQANSSNQLAACVIPSMSQYWIAIPTASTPSDNGVVWVLDFKKINENRIRWLRYDGLMVGAAYCVMNESGVDKLYIGGTNANKNIYRYDETVFNDNTATYRKYFKSKRYSRAFEGGKEDTHKEKEFNLFGMTFDNRTTGTSINIEYRFNGDSAKATTYGVTISESISGGQWSVSQWDAGAFVTTTDTEYPFIRSVEGELGRFARDIQFIVSAVTKDHDWTLREIFYEAKDAERKSVSRV